MKLLSVRSSGPQWLSVHTCTRMHTQYCVVVMFAYVISCRKERMHGCCACLPVCVCVCVLYTVCMDVYLRLLYVCV